MNNLFWRNTKASVKDEYQIPAVVEDLVLLDLTDIEMALYKNAGTKDGMFYLSPRFKILPSLYKQENEGV